MSGISKEPIKLADIKFRSMRKKDIPSVLQIERALFKDAWNFDHFLFEIEEQEYSNPTVLEYQSSIVAYFVCWIMFEEIHIANIAVHPDYQRMGIAQYMLNYIERELKTDESSILLEVRTGNVPAIRLYEKTGFKIYFERKYFYPDGENAYVMIKMLK